MVLWDRTPYHENTFNRCRAIHAEHAHLMLWALAQNKYYYEVNEIDTNPDEHEYPRT